MDLRALAGNRPSARRLQAALAATLALAALDMACSGGSAVGAQPHGPAGIPVKVEIARLVAVNDTTEYVATLKSRDTP